MIESNQQQIREWVKIFLEHVEQVGEEYHVNEEERYKFESVEHFQKHFDLEVSDLVAMLDEAILTNNLVAGSMYFPKKMLLLFAERDPAAVRNALQRLFDESRPVAERLTEVTAAFGALMEARNAELGETAHSYINLRFLSLLLALRYPEQHNPMKPAEWRVFAKFVNPDFTQPKRLTAGEQYELYQPFIEALREAIAQNPRVTHLKDRLTEGLVFADEAYRWMTQNVIYVGARAVARIRESETEAAVVPAPSEAEVEPEADAALGQNMHFPLERYLEDFMVENWANINFGEPLSIFIDEDGTPGQQYTTEVGILDILAVDAEGNFVVIELKRGSSRYHVIGQILNYIAWVKENLATNGQQVRGIVVVQEGHKTLHMAAKAVGDLVKIKYYRVKLDIVDPT